MRFAEVIAEDQAIVHRGLSILDRMVQRLEEGQRIEILDIRTMIKFLRAYGKRYPQSEVLELVGSIEASLNPKHGAGFVRSSRSLILLLRNQIYEEETGSAVTELLSFSQDPQGPIPAETYSDFARLELKYASKSRAVPIELDRRAHA